MRRKIVVLTCLVMTLTLILMACSGGGGTPEKTESNYSILEYPYGSLIVVRDDKTNLCGGFDTSGNLAVPCEYNTLEYIGTGSYGDRYIAMKDGKYGFIDDTGREVIPCEYDSINYPATIETTIPYELTDDLVVIEKDGKVGYCSLKDGAVVIEPKFTSADCFNGEELAAVFSDGGFIGYINRTGDMVIPNKFSEVGDFVDGLATVRDENGKTGVIDAEGKTVIPFKYDDFFSYYENGYAVAMEGEDGDNYRYIVVDSTGKEILSSNNQIYINGSLFGEYVNEEHYILYDRKGSKLTDEKYSEIIVMCEGANILIRDMDEKEGLFDCDGNLLIPCKYSRLENIFHDTKTGKQLWEARYDEAGYCKLIDEKGEEISTGDYSEIGRFSETGLAPVLHDGKVGFIDLTGKEVVPCDYYPATWSGDEPEEGFLLDSYNLAAVRKEGEDHYAIMDANGKVVTDYKYSLVSDTTVESETGLDYGSTVDILVVRDDGNKYGVVSLEGKELAPCGSFYAVGKKFYNELIPVKKDEGKLWSLMNMDGEIVTDPVFDCIYNQN